MKIYVKRLITAILFIAGLWGMIILSSNLFAPKSNEPDNGMEFAEANGILGEKKNTIDVLFLGDSETYASFIPLQIWNDTGYTSYVCGTSGQTLDYTNVMLSRALESQTPRIVFLETHTIFRDQTRDDYLYTRLCDQYDVFRYHDRWKTFQKDELNQKPVYTWTDDNKGFRFSKTVKASKIKDHMAPTDEVAEILPINRTCVDRIKKACDEIGAKLVFVSTPSTKNWNFSRHNAMVEYAREMECEYYDMNLMPDDIKINWKKDTKDEGDHLNYYGAKKVTTQISQYLVKSGILSSHKSDPSYKSWDEAYERFKKQIPKKKTNNKKKKKNQG